MSQENERDSFLSRWSRRKLQVEEGAEQHNDDAVPAEETLSQQDTAVEKPATEQEKPIWQRDDVDADTKKAALRKLFQKPEFNIRDGLNEYDDDFTRFAGLGSIVTHEMKRMLKLAEEKTRPAEKTDKAEPDSEQGHSQADNDKEDKDLA